MIDTGSPSLAQPDYWWYRVRAELLRRALGAYVPAGGVILDVGSADAPSAGWLADRGRVVPMDIDPRGLEAGGVCGSAEQLPFRSESLDVVAAFDVLEHCHRPGLALAEMVRVLRPGGLLALSVPAYRWAWTDHDVHNGHVTRYTRRRLVDAVEQSGAQVVRATYMFMGTFPFFAADRLRTRLKESRRDIGTPPGEMSDVLTLPEVSPLTEKVLLGASQVDRTLLGKVDLPFGSSVVCAARKSS